MRQHRVYPLVFALVALLFLARTATSSAASADISTSPAEHMAWSSSDGSAELTVGRNQPCPTGWLCLYEHSYWNSNESGRMLKFRDNRWQQLSVLGFNDKASSWRNHLGRNACVSSDWPAEGSPKLKLEPGSSAQLGGWSDEASGVKAGRC